MSGLHAAEPSLDPSAISTRQEFAAALTLLRERAGLTVRDVARAMAVPDSTVGGYFAGRHLPPVKPPEILRNLLKVCGIGDTTTADQWQEALIRVRHLPGPRPAGAPVPYRGLTSFQPDDAEWFYGRQRLIDMLVGRLTCLCADESFGIIAAVGPSGCGKSSLLRAGLVPTVRAGALPTQPGSDAWDVLLFTPGAHPVEALASAGQSPASGWVNGGTGRTEISRQLLVVVDQFEEVFTACQDQAERQEFISALARMAHPAAQISHVPGTPARAVAVLGLRADFYSHALSFPELVPALQDHQMVVGPMTEAELREAITQPARKAALEIEGGLVEVLLRDLAPTAVPSPVAAAYGAGALPLLSHALLATWECNHRRLTVADYRGSGGIHGAVARTAEQAYAALTVPEQELARRVILRLVHVSDDMAATRRRVLAGEFSFPDGAARHVLDRFITQRLITADTGNVEIAHEALLTAWPRLRSWIEADRADGRVHRQLSRAAETWQESGHDPSTLYRGSRLTAARDWADDDRHHRALNQLECAFLDTSCAQKASEDRAARRRARVLRHLVAALAVLTLTAGLLTAYAFQQKGVATGQRDQAISRQVAIDADQLRSTDISLAMQLALAAYQISPTPEARSSLLDSFATPAVTRVLGPPGAMQAVAFSPHGHTMAAAGQDPAIRLWDIARAGHPSRLGRRLAGDTATVFSLAFSPSGQTLASGSQDRTVRLWNMANRAGPVPWGPPLRGPATVYSVAFSRDGNLLATGGADGAVRLWDVTNPRQPRPLGSPLRLASGTVQSVAFSPDGHLLAAGGTAGSVRVWSVTSPAHAVPAGPSLPAGPGTVFSVAFSPAGTTLAAGNADGQVWLFDTRNPAHIIEAGRPLTGPTTWVNSVAFSPDGIRLAAGSSDSKVWVWNLTTRQVTTTLPQPAPVTSVVFLHNDTTLATSGTDGIARIWAIPGPAITGTAGSIWATPVSRSHLIAVTGSGGTARLWNVASPRHPIPVGPVTTDITRAGPASGAAALSPDGRILVAGADNGSAQMWDVADAEHPAPLAHLDGPAGTVQSITFSNSGRLLAITGNKDTTTLWDVGNPHHPVPDAHLTGLASYGLSVSFSPDGQLLAVGSADKLVHLWDIANPRRPVPLPALAGATSYVYTTAFSPDGRVLAEGGADDHVRLWDITSPRHVHRLVTLTGPTNYIYSLAFSPSGDTLAAATGGAITGSAWLWDVTKPAQPTLLATLTEPAGSVFADAFVPGRQAILATGTRSGLLRLWNTSTAQVAAWVCSVAGDRITRAEWAEYVPGFPYRPPCRRLSG